MTRISDPELDEYRAIAATEIRMHEGVMFRHRGTFTLRDSTWHCQFSVRDPAKVRGNQGEFERLQQFADSRGLVYTDLRVLSVHPDEDFPYPGATIPWDDGILEVLEWSQQSDFTDLRVGTCVLRRP